MDIRPATAQDGQAIWPILEPVIRAGETYALDRAMPREAALAYWLEEDKQTFLTQAPDGTTLGTYYLRANQPGGGGHVANCGYMTASAQSGRGVARQMFEHSLARARERSFTAMQFNFVVSSNVRAVRLWQACGFDIVGRLPLAFDHPSLGLVDALIMHRTL